MTVEIEREQYILRSDSACFWVDQVIERTDEKTGKTTVYTRNISGYYPTLRQLADWGLAPHVLRNSDATSLKNLLKYVKGVEERIANMTYRKVGELTEERKV